MRLTFANSSRIWGGAEIITATLLKGMKMRGHDVTLLCRPRSPFLSRVADGVKCRTTLGGFDANPVGIARSAWVLSRWRPDLLVTMTQKDPRIAGVAARLLGIPVLLRQPMDLGFGRSLSHRLFYGAVPNHYLANSYATRNSMLRKAAWLDPDSVTVVYNGIDVDEFANADPLDLGLPSDAIAIGFVGRFEERKGVRELMAAWPAIANALERVHLILVGEGGALNAEVREWAAVTDRVHAIGFRDDMPRVMAALDLLVVPSHFEGFGTVIAEAMAAGTPVVASRASNIPELIDCGVEGLLVPVRDPRALAEAVTTIASDPELSCSMGRAGRDRARREFDVTRMLDEYESLLQAIVDGRVWRSGRSAGFSRSMEPESLADSRRL